MIRVYEIAPMGAPRQSRKDAWAPSPAVLRYRAYRDEIRLRIKECDLPDEFFHVVFLVKMPKTWPKRKKNQLHLTRHMAKPDKDNLEKGLFDSVFRNKEDAHIWNSTSTKLWAHEGMIAISDRFLDFTGQFLPFDFEEAVRRG